MRSRKYYALILLTIVLIASVYLLIKVKHNQNTFIYDYRLKETYEYKVTSIFDLYTIDKVKNNMYLVKAENIDTDFKLGGFVLLREFIGDTIVSYRIQGTNVKKVICKKSYENIVSTTYYCIDTKYYYMISDLCDKLGKKE